MATPRPVPMTMPEDAARDRAIGAEARRGAEAREREAWEAGAEGRRREALREDVAAGVRLGIFRARWTLIGVVFVGSLIATFVVALVRAMIELAFEIAVRAVAVLTTPIS